MRFISAVLDTKTNSHSGTYNLLLDPHLQPSKEETCTPSAEGAAPAMYGSDHRLPDPHSDGSPSPKLWSQFNHREQLSDRTAD